jgi:hypothetical protein
VIVNSYLESFCDCIIAVVIVIMSATARQHFIWVPAVDRGHTDLRTVLAVVLSVDNDFYKLGTKYRVLKQLYARSEYTTLKEKFINLK